MRYPKVLSEWATTEHALTQSIARFGDGELRLALGIGKHIAQVHDTRMAGELRDILKSSVALACIPNAEAANGKPVMWGPTRYSAAEYVALYDPKRVYGSSFVTRPDSAPWIDTPDYWAAWCSLWNDRDVTLVIGTRGGSLTMLPRAKSVRLIYGPERDAYAAVDNLMNAIGTPDHPILICLGATATILAERLARKDVH